jgi:hypothetical protein
LFIGVATFLTAAVLQYGKAIGQVKVVAKTRTFIWVGIIIGMLLPGVYLAYKKWQEQKITLVENTKEHRITELEHKVQQLEQIIKARK